VSLETLSSTCHSPSSATDTRWPEAKRPVITTKASNENFIMGAEFTSEILYAEPRQHIQHGTRQISHKDRKLELEGSLVALPGIEPGFED
jgi:hypothetical protein